MQISARRFWIKSKGLTLEEEKRKRKTGEHLQREIATGVHERTTALCNFNCLSRLSGNPKLPILVGEVSRARTIFGLFHHPTPTSLPHLNPVVHVYTRNKYCFSWFDLIEVFALTIVSSLPIDMIM
ncbi:hypothetical protein L6164_031985 [Bauhinia variegata]|uniref:Uncharacterized protein n=1 Tax=Bauhinia variegata TaxID=167791 RepID=A0ACB9KN02_BAUVA|nr:hypothetical protein L6164_031985 [Bauhinia variegata]